MFCDACGAAVQAGQAYCGRCGKQIVGPVSVIPQRTGRVQTHIQLLGILWLAGSALNVLGGLILLVLANTLFAHLHEMGAPEAATTFLRPLLSVIGIFVLAKAAFGFLAGWGLMRREPWARILGLVMGFVALLNIPVGTVLGIYTLWVLLPAQSQQEYEVLVAAQAA
jgi:small-conductance mechanosensitive channel